MKRFFLPLLAIASATVVLTVSCEKENVATENARFGFVQTDFDNLYVRVPDSTSIPLFIRHGAGCHKWRENEYSILKKHLPYIKDVEYLSYFYIFKGQYTPLLPRISFKMDVADFSLESIAQKYDMELMDIGYGVYYLHCHVKTSQEVLDILEYVSKLEGLVWCQPEYFSFVTQY